MEALVSIETICSRYGCERHKAGTIMDKLPNFKVGNRRFAHERDLIDWERGQMNYPAIREKITRVSDYRIQRRKSS